MKMPIDSLQMIRKMATELTVEELIQVIMGYEVLLSDLLQFLAEKQRLETAKMKGGDGN
jgi:hypothetical protein